MREPTEEEVTEQYELAMDKVAEGGSYYPGMTYEQGVQQTIEWMNGETEDLPLDPEDLEGR